MLAKLPNGVTRFSRVRIILVRLAVIRFDVILVYDVSRWGRFQDADEAAFCEYRCKAAGIRIEYCAEQFENDGSPVATIVKGVKRAMAGEYCRELSVKVFAGQCRLIELGYRQGGPAGFGLRQVLVDAAGNHKGELSHGEQKSIQTDRIILMPGPEHEVATVEQIYRWFVEDRLVESEIAARLNAQGILTDFARPALPFPPCITATGSASCAWRFARCDFRLRGGVSV